MNRWIRGGLGALCLFAAATYAQTGSTGSTGNTGTESTDSTRRTGTMGSSPGSMGSEGTSSISRRDVRAAVQLPKDEKGYLERLHHLNQMEIRLGNLAQQKASEASVRSFGQMMVTEHQQADEQLLSYAKSKKLSLGQPKPISDRERKMINAERAQEEVLRILPGIAFDQSFMTAMVGGHDKAINKIVAGQEQFNTGELASLLAQLAPRIAQHREQAYRILGELKVPVEQLGVGGAGSEPEKKN